MSGEVEVLLYTNVPMPGFVGRTDNSIANRRKCVDKERCSRNMRSCSSIIKLECLIQCLGKKIVW